MAHYFEYNPDAGTERKKLTFHWNGQDIVFMTGGGVFSKNEIDHYSLLMVNCMESFDVSGEVLDLGCGYGTVGILLAKRFAHINLHQSDVNKAAVDLTRENGLLNGVNAQVYLSDGYDNIAKSFDWVFLNPPIHAGKETVYKLFRDTKAHLKENGQLVIVIQKKHGAESALRELEGIYKSVQVVYKKKGVHVIICDA